MSAGSWLDAFFVKCCWSTLGHEARFCRATLSDSGGSESGGPRVPPELPVKTTFCVQCGTALRLGRRRAPQVWGHTGSDVQAPFSLRERFAVGSCAVLEPEEIEVFAGGSCVFTVGTDGGLSVGGLGLAQGLDGFADGVGGLVPRIAGGPGVPSLSCNHWRTRPTSGSSLAATPHVIVAMDWSQGTDLWSHRCWAWTASRRDAGRALGSDL